MAVKLLFQGIPQFEDSSGNPYTNARLFFYVAGSSTKQNTYSDSAGSTANDNPITLNSSGYPAVSGNIVQIWGTTGQTYKIGLAAPGSDDPPASFIWSSDNVSPINDTSVSVDEWVSGPEPTYVSSTSFTLVGDQTSTFMEGRRLKVTDSGGTKYCTITGSSFGAATTVTVAGDALASPTSAVSYSLMSATNPSISSEMIYRKGTAVASGATCDIWNTQGDFLHITGNTGPITSFGTAPYAGAQKTLIFDSTPTITHNATSLQLPWGGSIVAAAGDRAVVRADTTANMIVVDYIRAGALTLLDTTRIQDDADITKQFSFQASGITAGQIRALTVQDYDVTIGGVLGTEVTLTAVTTIDFTGIPSGVRRIEINISSVSMNGSTSLMFQLGDGAIETSGYTGSALRVTNGATESGPGSNLTASFRTQSADAGGIYSGQVVLSRQSADGTKWTCMGQLHRSDQADMDLFGGTKTLSSALDRVRMGSTDGTSTFDSGTINILYFT